MRYQTTKEILEHARAYHHRLSEYYLELQSDTEQERIRLLLNYLSRHERHMEQALAKYTEDASHKILNTWFSYAPDEHMLDACARLDLHPDMDVDDIVAAVVRYDNCLIEMFRDVEQTASIPEVREAFANLLLMEEQAKEQSVRNGLLMRDM